MELQQARLIVERLPVLLDFSDNQKYRIVNALMGCSEVVRVSENTCLFKEGDAESEFGYVLLDGELRVENSNGFVKVVNPPALVGEMRQFNFEGGGKRAATVTALEPLTVLRFSWPKLDLTLMESLNPEECVEFTKALQIHAWMHYLEREDEL
jgi:CRP-like cAMP-binding protein